MLTQAIHSTTEYKRLYAAVTAKPVTAALFGLPPIGRAIALASLCGETGRPALLITPGEAEATRLAEDITTLGVPAAVFPARDYVMRNIEGQSREYEYRRLEVLGRLVSRRVQVVVAPVEAVLQSTVPKEDFLAGTLSVKAGRQLPQKELLQTLLAAGYFRREQIDGPGQFSVRGGIVDVYPPDMAAPARIEYWGDEIDSIHTFDLLTQRRDTAVKTLHISPSREVLFGDADKAAALLRNALKNAAPKDKKAVQAVVTPDIELLENGVLPEGMDKYLPLRYPVPGTLFDYLKNPIVIFDEPSGIEEEADAVAFRTQQQHVTMLEESLVLPRVEGYYTDFTALLETATAHHTIFAENFARQLPAVPLADTIDFPAHLIPPWPGSLDALVQELKPLTNQNYYCVVLVGTQRAANTLALDLMEEGFTVIQPPDDDTVIEPVPGGVAVLPGRLSAGANFTTARYAVFTSRRHGEAAKKRKRPKGKGLSSLSEIDPGDYVVHQSYGIGRYAGIERLDLQGAVKDYLKIEYDKADVLYVPVTQLDLLSRYSVPGEEKRVRLAKLGGQEWARTKSRVRAATQEMAQDLIELYAKREQAKGFSFPADTEWQRDFEARFEFEETPEQLVAAQEIKTDMEQSYPMDRLLSGDVGVGKTEVALRAAFKCVMGGKQCAILVPTTILAWQHYNTMLNRMENFPVNVEMMSRFKTGKEMKETVKGIGDGSVDIVVGTHRLLQKDVRFNNLGLLIIDEEQRFGVRHKEKLKEAFVDVDVLTLSATPIPRTLSMALSGIRDMSSIEEPPTERQPVETYVMEYDQDLIISAIKRELARAGQVYYLHNRVETIEYAALRLKKRLPDATIATAHGRMDEMTLSRTWQRLLNGEIDVLVCTTIIETGVDVPNCNTLIIEDADRMGLAQLYQIRGRVGRSGRKAYAYFTFQRDKVLTDVASKRLSAIREFTAFGSGFRIAMRDLQIRGAGNLLGQSQSGHMEAVGYELYVKMLNQAVAMAKGETFTPDKAETLIDITIDAYIPEKYIPSNEGRIEAYKKIAAIQSGADAADVTDELRDRYGKLPRSVEGLVEVSLLRVVAAELGIYEVLQRKDTLLLYSDQFDFNRLSDVIKKHKAMVNASAKPYLAVRLRGDALPLDILSAFVTDLHSATCNPPKKEL